MRRHFLLLAFLAAFSGAVFAPPRALADEEYTTERITYRTSDGVNIAGTFFRPAKLRMQKVPVVIMLHMLSRSRNDWNAIAPLVMAEGYCALAIDLRGHGESLEFDQAGRTWREFGDGDFRSMLLDVSGAVSYLATRKEVNTDRIAIIGASIGANLAINYAAQDRHVRTVVLLSPGLNYRGIETMPAAERYGTRAIMIVASESDNPSAADSRALYERLLDTADPPKLKMYPGNRHGTDILSAGNGLDRIIMAWLNNNLLF
ncbi:MAG: alpha/beta fold hydrolase [bacterium]